MDHYGPDVFTEELEFSLIFNAHGATQLYIKWAETGMQGSAEDQARFALKCMPPCIKQFLPLNADDY